MKRKVYSFHEYAHKQHREGKITDEKMVRIDMIELGLDPNSKASIEEYWKFMHGAADFEIEDEEDDC
jgi:hypothetical protein